VEGFRTASGSAYQVDLEAQRIRRLGNSAGLAPTPRQGVDGHWRRFHALAFTRPPAEGVSVVIDWDGRGALTITSELRGISPALATLLDAGGDRAAE
jgi:hypothetical protein